MAKELRFEGKVAIITGAGNGLGRAHALLLAGRGAKVVVNDLGGSAFGAGKSSAAADKVVEEIRAAGGEAVANHDSVEDGAKIVQSALDSFGRLDIVINNAGILRDTTFHKMTQEDWDLIYKVHVLGGFRVTHAAWPHLRDQGYGRIIFTASAAGIYGNFGQANYSMAKLGLLGLANTLALEGKKKGVFVNTIAPLAGSRLTETVLPKELIEALKPEYVSPLVAWLCHDSCTETGGLFELGAGFFSKLRWERSAGATLRLGRPMTIEAVQKAWPKIAGFDKTSHPADIAQSMAPVMANVQAGPSKGGNEFIDVDQALGYEFEPVKASYDERDVAIYALGVGASQNPLDDEELRYVYEMHRDGFVVLPTFGVAPVLKAIFDQAKQGKQAPGMSYGFDRILHGEQYLEIMRPLPQKAQLEHKVRIKDIFDKGKNALVITEVKSYDEAGDLLAVNELTTVVRGAGGWGGDRGPTGELNAAPSRAPDATIEERINENQALLYRLSGDWNPLHADPGFASAFGFPRPILHGLCTFGYAARHVIRSFAKNKDARFFKSIKARFADSVFPGETIITEMWKESEGRVVFRCKVKERDKVVISNAAVEFYDQIPEKKAAPKKAEAPAKATAEAAPAQALELGHDGAASGPKPPAPAEPISADVFIGIGKYLEKNPGLAGKVAMVYLFKLTGPDSAWVVDLKNGGGKVSQSAGEKADCTLELSDADFMAMCTGKADAQKLYFGGKLKISGNVMASQKLEFLKNLDPQAVIDAMKARTGGGASAPAPAAAPAAPPAASAPKAAAPAAPAKAALAPEIFERLKERLAQNPGLAKEVAAVVQFRITSPNADWTVDLKTEGGAVRLGVDKAADVTLTLADEDFAAMVKGADSAQHLFQSGKMRADGDLRIAASRLGFLKDLS
jgi:3-hydroxyacyl-CoA dehydrogenase/3a,7a,12a-trihydroxy-5b-cholest-24-enoyl-CoA hydratase